MDADRPKFSINLPQYEQEQARTLYAVDFDMARARSAAEDARNADQNDARSRHQPHASEKAKAVWQGREAVSPTRRPSRCQPELAREI